VVGPSREPLADQVTSGVEDRDILARHVGELERCLIDAVEGRLRKLVGSAKQPFNAVRIRPLRQGSIPFLSETDQVR
jgi:hypothetical protein